MHHPWRRNVTTLVVGLKSGHMRKNLTQKWWTPEAGERRRRRRRHLTCKLDLDTLTSYIVPQGSPLVPVFFNVYSKGLLDLSSNGLTCIHTLAGNNLNYKTARDTFSSHSCPSTAANGGAKRQDQRSVQASHKLCGASQATKQQSRRCQLSPSMNKQSNACTTQDTSVSSFSECSHARCRLNQQNLGAVKDCVLNAMTSQGIELCYDLPAALEYENWNWLIWAAGET